MSSRNSFDEYVTGDEEAMTDNQNPTTPPESPVPTPADTTPPGAAQTSAGAPPPAPDMQQRVDRLAGEPAPDITPEEFARLQKLGSLNIDPRGRVRPDLGREDDPGVSVRKRRAWYG
jgi:hypothetical protein